jgi:uncharacterized Zn finger protein
MIELPRNTSTTECDSCGRRRIAHGQWGVVNRDGRKLIIVACPECGVVGDLDNHIVDDKGVVSPSLICSTCGWHFEVKLLDYNSGE